MSGACESNTHRPAWVVLVGAGVVFVEAGVVLVEAGTVLVGAGIVLLDKEMKVRMST